jgi:hypothetical protein
MSPDQQLEFMKASALSLAAAIQEYQGMKLKMIEDRHDVVDFIAVDGQAVGDAIATFKEDLFIKGAESAVRVNRIGNDKVTGRIGSK